MGNKNFLKSSLIVVAAATTTLAFIPRVDAVTAVVPSFTGSAHVQRNGWDDSVASPTQSMKGAILEGTIGESKRMEAVKLDVMNAPAGMELKYRAHVQGDGWQEWVNRTQTAGTEGKSKRMEALEISVANTTGYVVKYRGHVQGIGWMDWVTASNSEAEGKAEPSEGTYAGTIGKSLRLEAIEVTILSATENELEEAKKNAIAELRNKYNAQNYTQNITKFNDQMEQAIAKINSVQTKNALPDAFSNAEGLITVPTDIKVAEIVKKAKEDLKNDVVEEYAKVYLNKIIRNSSDINEKYIKIPGISSVIKEVETTIDNIKYEDVSTTELFNQTDYELKFKIFSATKEYAKEAINDIYNNATAISNADDAKLMKTEQYEKIIKDLDDIRMNNVGVAQGPKLQEVINIVEKCDDKTDQTTGKKYGVDTLKDVRNQFVWPLTGTLDKLLNNDKTPLFTGYIQEDTGVKMKTRESGVTKYTNLAGIQEAINDAKAIINKAVSYEDMENAEKEAKEKIVKIVKTYMANTIDALLIPGNSSLVAGDFPEELLKLRTTNYEFDNLEGLIQKYNSTMASNGSKLNK